MPFKLWGDQQRYSPRAVGPRPFSQPEQRAALPWEVGVMWPLWGPSERSGDHVGLLRRTGNGFQPPLTAQPWKEWAVLEGGMIANVANTCPTHLLHGN